MLINVCKGYLCYCNMDDFLMSASGLNNTSEEIQGVIILHIT